MNVFSNIWPALITAGGGLITGVILPAEKLLPPLKLAAQALLNIVPPLQARFAPAVLKGSLEMADTTTNPVASLPAELAKIGQEVLSFIENNPEAFAQVGNDLFTDAMAYLRGDKAQLIPDLQKTIQAIPQLPAIIKDANVSLWIATGLANALISQAQTALANGQAALAAAATAAPPAVI